MASATGGHEAVRPNLRQGDWISGILTIPLMSEDGASSEQETPHGVAVITQCCDLAQNKTGFVQVAPIRELDGVETTNVRRGRSSRYCALPTLQENHHVDLGVITSIAVGLIGNNLKVYSLESERERREFAASIARRYARFAYPDSYRQYLDPLRDAVRNKAGKPNSPLGNVIERIATLRLEAEPSWDAAADVSLKLLLVVEDGYLPSSDGPPQASAALRAWKASQRGIADIASRLLETDASDPDTAILWNDLAEAMADLMSHKADPAGPAGEIDCEVMNTHELTYARVLRSVDLDLDDLSPGDTILGV